MVSACTAHFLTMTIRQTGVFIGRYNELLQKEKELAELNLVVEPKVHIFSGVWSFPSRIENPT